MKNVLVKGHKVIKQPGDPEQSTIEYPINADYWFTAEVKAYDEIKKEVQLESVWDENNPGSKETFFAQARYLGRAGTPLSSEVQTGQLCFVARTGESNQPGPYTGLAIRDPSVGLASFVAFFFTE